MRSLVVTRWMPWPPISGARHRSSNMIEALASLGDVDVFVLDGDADESGERAVPTEWPVARLGRTHRAAVDVRRVDRLAAGLPWSKPAAVRRLDVAAERAAVGAWVNGPYDLQWIVRIESWITVRGLVTAPTVVDFDDLRDDLVRSGDRSSWRDGDGTGRRRVVGRLAAVADAAAWRRLQRQVASEVAAVTVCSSRDQGLLGVPNSAIVPNGVVLPAHPRGRDEVGPVPTMCFFGSLGYGPNADAAGLLVREVAPRVRTQIPELSVRLVGRRGASVEQLADPPRVVVTGLVPDIEDELAKADVVAVPLREGAGTRIKVLEALAHRIPVVATTIAVEGLDLVHGRHLLVADDPDTFASACTRLLQDVELRRALADEGEQIVRRRYGWDRSLAAVEALAASIGGG